MRAARPSVRSLLEQSVLLVFPPTTPNPTSGFFLFLKEIDAKILDKGIDQAVKLAISAGLVCPAGMTSAARLMAVAFRRSPR